MTHEAANSDTMILERAYRLDEQVALRPEPFGALAYHYGNRRLVFLRSVDMFNVVRTLDAHDSVAQTLAASGVDEARWPAFLAALSSLESSQVIHAR
jgi:mycofactocin biosynthesis protein MftB